jgi:hypothetical protein
MAPIRTPAKWPTAAVQYTSLRLLLRVLPSKSRWYSYEGYIEALPLRL